MATIFILAKINEILLVPIVAAAAAAVGDVFVVISNNSIVWPKSREFACCLFFVYLIYSCA